MIPFTIMHNYITENLSNRVILLHLDIKHVSRGSFAIVHSYINKFLKNRLLFLSLDTRHISCTLLIRVHQNMLPSLKAQVRLLLLFLDTKDISCTLLISVIRVCFYPLKAQVTGMKNSSYTNNQGKSLCKHQARYTTKIRISRLK